MGVIKMKCSICKGEIDRQHLHGDIYWDEGHNAQPINDGRCCTKCNCNIVIPYRISLMMKKNERVENE
tara:strand:+ start:1183 stop:1386 length:204 start_codon:yes stop_codon:yes gene_type:complete